MEIGQDIMGFTKDAVPNFLFNLQSKKKEQVGVVAKR
jgi:hypothetical protein